MANRFLSVSYFLVRGKQASLPPLRVILVFISNGVDITQLKSTGGKRKANRIPLSPLNTDGSTIPKSITPTFDKNSNGDHTKIDFKANMYEDAEKAECVNFGQPEFTCIFCHAELWFEERADKTQRLKMIQVTLICR
ncbi:hypothetical protein P8452_32673 [Trifolium repens]|nr:hypothetical protein P8452_32673 [Trifolium repens]